ncbi:D-alanine--D-alanine ligase [Telluribacter sp. SYSU D00476]|uniref:D-alanine--D-alanine ligase family protein n=1 Tax=Telluribacter sp. SYSU D00476 TaxID=2811430 RepID=UPI001FF14AFD|nr:D-alanine--D-alanine ligase [Telluribacter sp. SYSU D00476]
MRIGIFFGGPSREREISFAGGKTAFENLDKQLFEPVPVFVDSFGRFIKLDPRWMYETSIRDFFPSPVQQTDGYRVYIESLPHLAHVAVSPEVGELITPDKFRDHFDFAMLAMHGPDCEDGAIQGLLEWYRIPYSGPGLMGSAVGIDKVLQNEMIALANGQDKGMMVVRYDQWQRGDRQQLFEEVKGKLGVPIVVKAPHQGSSIGVAIVRQDSYGEFVTALNQCFFQMEVGADEWLALDQEARQAWAQRIANLDEGIGFPVVTGTTFLYHPKELIAYLDKTFLASKDTIILSSAHAEDQVLLEAYVSGQEFSCGCIQHDDGSTLVLPPTEIIKIVEVFDFNSKYKPGATRKRIPVNTTLANNQKIQYNIGLVFQRLGINVCARIDGFLTPEGEVLLHDPNTIPGMSPTSLIFKQMAEIGLNVTQAITYFIRQSIRERIRTGKDTWHLRQLLQTLDDKINLQRSAVIPAKGILFEATDEQYAKARQCFGKLNAEGKCTPVPVLKLDDTTYYQLPVPLMFKDYVEDLLALVREERDPLLVETSERAAQLTAFYAGRVEYGVKMGSTPEAITPVEDWVVLCAESV